MSEVRANTRGSHYMEEASDESLNSALALVALEPN
jgi:hypothetical protein